MEGGNVLHTITTTIILTTTTTIIMHATATTLQTLIQNGSTLVSIFLEVFKLKNVSNGFDQPNVIADGILIF